MERRLRKARQSPRLSSRGVIKVRGIAYFPGIFGGTAAKIAEERRLIRWPYGGGEHDDDDDDLSSPLKRR